MAIQPSKVTILDARGPLKAPLADILMAASEGRLKLHAVARGWQASSGIILDEWVRLDARDILHSLNCDHILVKRVYQGGHVYTLAEPQKVMMGAVYVEPGAEVPADAQARPVAQPATAGDDFISTKEAARLLGCGANTLEKWRSQGLGGPPFYRISGRTIRYKHAEVLAWREKNPIKGD